MATTEDYWQQRAELYRKSGGMALAPDEPIWAESGRVAEGSLSEILECWSKLPPSHQQYHVINIAGGSLSEAIIRGLLEQPAIRDVMSAAVRLQCAP